MFCILIDLRCESNEPIFIQCHRDVKNPEHLNLDVVNHEHWASLSFRVKLIISYQVLWRETLGTPPTEYVGPQAKEYLRILIRSVLEKPVCEGNVW